MEKMVVGFAFTEAKDKVVLIQKTRPEWQRGRLNGLGGKVKAAELPPLAMSREFQEEAGVLVHYFEWNFCGRYFCRRKDPWEVLVYSAFTDAVNDVRTASDEGLVGLYDVSRLPKLNVLPNVRWLIPLLLYANLKEFRMEEP